MSDYSVGVTIYKAFTTRAFATGIPTVLAGTPVVSAYEDAGLTQITAGITLGVDHDSVVGLNMLTIVATGGNGFEAGKDYNLVITTGTVGGVSVVGEVVGHFSLERSAAIDEIGAAGAGLTEAGATGDHLTAVPWNAAWDAEVQSEVNDALVAQKLDHLVAVADADDVVNDSIIAKMVSSAATADWSGFVNTTDALQAIRDHIGDGTNLTEAGATGNHLTAIPWNAAWDAEVQSEVDDALDTAIAELGVAAPTATPTLRTAVMLMYMALRNKLVVQTSGTDALEIHNNAGTKIAAKLLTDDGSDYTEAEMA